MIRRALLAALAAWPMASSAETLYVSDRLVIGLRSDITDSATILKSVETGTALEVLERHGTRVRVRGADGGEGWVEERYLTAQAPVRTRVAELEGEIKRLRAAAARVPAKDDTAAKLAQRETELAATHAALTQAKSDASQARQALAAAQRDAAAKPPAPAPEPGLSAALWLLIGFAMLGVGFIAGMVWVRESIRRRMGGMYLRI